MREHTYLHDYGYPFNTALDRFDISRNGGDNTEAHRAMQHFKERWGDLDQEALRRILQEGEGWEVGFAAVALYRWLGDRFSPEAVTFLTSSNPWLRWSMALEMGQDRRNVAFPVLCDLLTEGMTQAEFADTEHFPPDGVPKSEWEWGEEEVFPSQEASVKEEEDETSSPLKGEQLWRYDIPRLLVRYHRKQAIPFLCHALHRVVGYARQLRREGKFFQRSFLTFILFALGRCRAWGALTAFAQETPQWKNWAIILSMGALYGTFEPRSIWKWEEYTELHKKLGQCLTRKFGLSEEESQAALEVFGRKIRWKSFTNYLATMPNW